MTDERHQKQQPDELGLFPVAQVKLNENFTLVARARPRAGTNEINNYQFSVTSRNFDAVNGLRTRTEGKEEYLAHDQSYYVTGIIVTPKVKVEGMLPRFRQDLVDKLTPKMRHVTPEKLGEAYDELAQAIIAHHQASIGQVAVSR
jgi:hypothetical protein